MSKFSLTIVSLMLITGSMILTGCDKSSKPTTTPDANVVYTQAYETVAAKLTQTAEFMPTATSTSTPEPSPTATLATPTSTTPLATTPVVNPTNTLRPTSPDRALWISQNPADYTQFTPGQNFTMTWRIQNIGTSTWSTQYQFRFYAGSAGRMNASDIFLPKEVKPNEEIELTLQMTAPDTAGEQNSIWVLTNADGINYYSVSILINVAGAAYTPTSPAPTATISPTATPTP